MIESFDKNYKFTILTILILFFGLSVFTVYTHFSKTSSSNYLAVTGSFNKDVDNKIASFSINTNGEDADKQKAEQINSEKIAKVLEVIKQFGISEKDYTTQNYNSYRKIEYYTEGMVQKSRETNWIYNQTITLTLKDVTKVNQFVDAVNNINAEVVGPNYTIDKDNLDEATILNGAFEKAKQKAEVLATASGRKLGKVISINEVTSSTPEFLPIAVKAFQGGGAASPDLPAGSSKVEKSVHVLFELN